MAAVLQARKTATWVGTTTNPAAVTLTSGWTNGAGGASYTPVENDLVLVSYSIGGTSDVDVTMATSGYTEIADIVGSDTSFANLGVFRKFMGATPDTTVQFGPTTSAAFAGAVTIEVWSGIDTTTPEDTTATTATGSNTGQPDPPSITPVTSGAQVVVFGAAAASTGAVFTQSGSELSDFLSARQNDTVDAMVGVGTYSWTSGAFNPIAWTGGTTGANDSWAAVCVALRPTASTAVPSSFGFIF